jgi:hypothetical protein
MRANPVSDAGISSIIQYRPLPNKGPTLVAVGPFVAYFIELNNNNGRRDKADRMADNQL